MRLECHADPNGYITIRARLECDALLIRRSIEFFIDTGSPISIISPSDTLRVGVPYDRLEPIDTPISFGGHKYPAYILPDVRLVFRVDKGTHLFSHAMSQIYVLEPVRLAPGEKPVPSILGSDFLDCYNLVITKGRKRIIVTDEDLDI